MAKRIQVAAQRVDTKPVCRLVSLLPENRLESAGANDKQGDVRRIAASVAMVTLLGLACTGVVFTLKHRQLKNEKSPATELVQNENRPPSHIAIQPKPKIVLPPQQPPGEELVIPPVEIPVNPPMPPAPAIIEPEVLATAPREVGPAGGLNPAPMVVENKPRPDPMGATTLPPVLPATSIPDEPKEKTVVQPRKKLPDTEPAIDPRLATFGTRIGFHANFAEASEAAKKDDYKPVLVVHYAGKFDGQSFSSTASEEFRANCLLNPEVVNAIQSNFVCSAKCISLSRDEGGGRTSGTVVTYLCRWNGEVLHAIAGPVSAEQFLREMTWMLQARNAAATASENGKDPLRYAASFRKAHTARFFELTGADFSAPNFQIPPMSVPPVQKLPAKCPPEVSHQAKVHWYLGTNSLKQLASVYQNIYVGILNQTIVAPQ